MYGTGAYIGNESSFKGTGLGQSKIRNTTYNSRVQSVLSLLDDSELFALYHVLDSMYGEMVNDFKYGDMMRDYSLLGSIIPDLDKVSPISSKNTIESKLD